MDTRGHSRPWLPNYPSSTFVGQSTVSFALIYILKVEISLSSNIAASLSLDVHPFYGGYQCYPVCSAEVDSFGKVVALVEAAVIGSREGHHKLSSALIGPIHLWGKTNL